MDKHFVLENICTKKETITGDKVIIEYQIDPVKLATFLAIQLSAKYNA